ncbi:MAG: FkbM family methyltransferase [Flavobacteriales bacterium]|nr:FkbM family methyltransferase [Flavobacteriales bacterium]MCX7650427.1 FkbM family methyltransferase [Flavobacteriales bacterium]MDW8432039.1 FkbM family methyltransferase [Flavobacteriales bacterium]
MRQFLLPGENFVDVGANIGFISISAAQVLGEGTIWAFEPNPEAREILEKNIALNKIRNIQVLPYALGSSEGQGEIFINAIAHNRGGATLLDIEKRKDGKTYSVEIKRLDKLLPENFSLAMMKIDVEGFEMEVLKGAEIWLRKKDAPALIVECSLERNTTNFSGVDLFNYIKGLNKYLIFKLAKGKNRLSKLQEIKNEKDLPRHDNIFCFLPEQLPRLHSMF